MEGTTSGWLSRFEIDEAGDPVGPMPAETDAGQVGKGFCRCRLATILSYSTGPAARFAAEPWIDKAVITSS